jgi:hypothetical protein
MLLAGTGIVAQRSKLQAGARHTPSRLHDAWRERPSLGK